MSNTGHFWYSAKQRAHLDSQAAIRANGCAWTWFAKLKDGRVVEYTEWTSGPTSESVWPDKKYLGEGEYLRRERRIG